MSTRFKYVADISLNQIFFTGPILGDAMTRNCQSASTFHLWSAKCDKNSAHWQRKLLKVREATLLN